MNPRPGNIMSDWMLAEKGRNVKNMKVKIKDNIWKSIAPILCLTQEIIVDDDYKQN